MLKIRDTQMQTLSGYTLQQFAQRMATYLRSNFPQHTDGVSETDLQASILSSMAQAKQYNIILEDDVRRYLEYVTMYGVNFDTNPQCAWAGDILRLQDISGGEKMDRIDTDDLFGPRGQL